MQPVVSLDWPAEWTAELSAQALGLFRAVVALGGAIGWMSGPTPAAAEAWLTSAFAAIARGDGAMCTGWRGGQLVALGMWRRDEAGYMPHTAELVKIMVHPQARGLRLGRLVTEALVASAAAAGIETLHLGVRGNNQLAIQSYEEAGFTEWGRLPNVIEVGDLRFDDVRMYRKLGQPPQVRSHGSHPSGPGSSPRRPAT